MEQELRKPGLRMPNWFYWGIALAGAYIIYRTSEVLVPFILSFVLAYILDPIVDAYERKGVKREHAIALVFVIVLIALILFIAIILPPVVRQMRQVEAGASKYLREVHHQGERELIKQQDDQEVPSPSPSVPAGVTPTIQPSESPAVGTSETPAAFTSSPTPSPGTLSNEGPAPKEGAYIDSISVFWLGLITRYPILKEHIGDEKTVRKIIAEREKEIASYSVKILGGISTWALSSLSNLMFIILVPLLTFYFLCVIDPLKDRILFLITDEEKKREVMTISSEINVMLGNYLKGQLTVSFLVGFSVATVAFLLSLVFHTKYSLLLGFLTGVTCIIPYFGAILSTTVAILIGLLTATTNPLLAALVFPACLLAINQLFDNFITPRIVGEQVGLHPLWTLFALLAGGKLFGVAGMIIAVPIAATIKICLIRLFPRLIEPIPHEEVKSTIARQRKPAQAQEPLQPAPVDAVGEPATTARLEESTGTGNAGGAEKEEQPAAPVSVDEAANEQKKAPGKKKK